MTLLKLQHHLKPNLKTQPIEATLLKAKSMATEITIKQKKEWAELLFMRGDLTQKAIAEKVGTSEKTLSGWVTKDNWDKLRKSMLTTKTEILRNLYDILDKIGKKLKEDDSYGDSKIADMYVKYTAAINNLETETSTGQIFEVGRMFVNWLQDRDPQFALLVLNNLDAFIKDNLKKY